MNLKPLQKRPLPIDLNSIFRPKSVAVIGAGRDPASMSGRLFRNLLASFCGPVYPVNPVTPEICAVRTFPSILAIPEPVDLAFVAVPAASVLPTVRQCIEKGVRGLVVITAGFSETDAAGRRREDELSRLVQAAGVPMIGPNCFGVFNTDPAIRLQGTFAASAVPRGNVGICTQSGALGLIIPDFLRRWNLGASTFASIGNKADINENDLLRYWRDDPATDVVLLYLESFANPREFRELAAETSRHKPVIALKAARTPVGARAAASHTAALAGSHEAADALLAQSGVLRVDTLQELFEVPALLASQPLPRGRRVAVLTNAGGPAILCADALAGSGLSVPEFSSGLQAKLRRLLRPEAGVKNPIDLIGSIDPNEFRQCLILLMESVEVDSIITIYVPREAGTAVEVARAVHDVTATHASGKTSLAVFLQTEDMPAELGDERMRVPGYLFPEAAARALAGSTRLADFRASAPGRFPSFPDIHADECRRIVDDALARFGTSDGWLDASTAQQLLTAVGLRLPRWKLVHTPDEAVAIAFDWQSPVALKVVSPTVLHKSDVGGVLLDIRGETGVRTAFTQVLRSVSDAAGILVQEYIPEGHEVFIGALRDSQFGHLITFGAGGVLVEILQDVVCRVHPLTDRDAHEMVGSIRAAPLHSGFRGGTAADVPALEEALLRISILLGVVPEIAELDLNPVKALPPGHGVRVIDARIRIGQ